MNVITKNVAFEQGDYVFVRKYAEQQGYGQRGFSAALRHMIRFFMERTQSSAAIEVRPGEEKPALAERPAAD